VRALGADWWLHSICKDDKYTELVLGFCGAEAKIKALAEELKALEAVKLSNFDVVELLQLRHSNCYKTEDWGALE
jgi:hypothetical protein